MLPEVAEWPHLEVLHIKNFLAFGLAAVFPGTASASRSGGIGLWFRVWGRVADLVAVHFLLVPTGARSASPAITTRGLSKQRRLHAGHVEMVLASVALHGIGAGMSFSIHFRRSPLSTYVGHHSLQWPQSRTLSVRSGTTSFSATTYSYREQRTSLICFGTVGK